MITDTPVRIGLEGIDAVALQPIAAECPVCFAIVRKLQMAAHKKAVHPEAEA